MRNLRRVEALPRSHKNYRRVRQRRARSHTASILYSPVRFALRTLSLRRGGAFPEYHQRGKVNYPEMEAGSVRDSRGNRSEIALPGEDFAAEGNAPVQGDDRKVRAACPFAFRPGLQGGCNAGHGYLQQMENTVVESHSSQMIAIFRPLRAQLQELHDPGIVSLGSRRGNSSDFAHFHGENVARGGGRQRAAVRHKKHQQRGKGNNEDERGHHRGTATRFAGTSRASSEWRIMVTVQESGKRQPRMGPTRPNTEYLLARLTSA